MPELSEDYASPGLRWSLLLHDHPGAEYKAELKKGAEIGLPDAYGGGDNLCVVTIVFPEAEIENVVGYKPVRAHGTADDWNIAVTKTLGRALKKAGYPDDLGDLKALMHWRQRTKELAALETGHAVAALGTGEEPALRGTSPEAVTGDDRPDSHQVRGDDAPDGGTTSGDDTPDGPVVDVEEVRAAAPAPEPTVVSARLDNAWSYLPEELRVRVDRLPEREQGQLVSKLDQWGIFGKSPDVGEARKIAAYVKSLEAVAKAPAKAPKPAPAAEAPAASEQPVVEAEAFVEDAKVTELLNRYESLSPALVEAVDKVLEEEGLSWNFPMPVATFDRLAQVVAEHERVAA